MRMSIENPENLINFVKGVIFHRSRIHQKENPDNYSLVLKACLMDYVSHIRFNIDDYDVKMKTVDMCKDLMSVLTTSLKGQQAEAYLKMKSILKSLDDDGLFCEHDVESFLYRMRVCDLRRNIARKELFHIPFNMIRRVETQRYSTPGLPCLYLARSIYCCWEEMHRPSIENTLVSAFKAQDDFDLVDLRIPDIERFRLFESWYMKAFPLIIACSIPVVHEKSAFKPEYIIPQFVLQWVIEDGGENKAIGVTYTSTFATKDFFELDYEWDNIVLPAIEQIPKSEYCNRLARLFKVTKPTCYEYEVMTGNMANTGVWDHGPKRLSEGNPKNVYYLSIFSRMEEELETRDFDYIYNTL